MDKLNEITYWIEKNSFQIIDNIDFESIEVYEFLQEQFKKTNVDENFLFQFVFRSFYRLDNAGLTPDFKKEFFRILEENRKCEIYDFETILRRLYEFKNRKGQNTFQFSFVTKLFNTIDNKTPIYDSEVARMFSLTRPYHSDFDRKIDMYLNHFELIAKAYDEIIYKNLLPLVCEDFDRKFLSHNLNDMKKLDFIFWSAGKIKSKSEMVGDDGFHRLEELEEIERGIKKESERFPLNTEHQN